MPWGAHGTLEISRRHIGEDEAVGVILERRAPLHNDGPDKWIVCTGPFGKLLLGGVFRRAFVERPKRRFPMAPAPQIADTNEQGNFCVLFARHISYGVPAIQRARRAAVPVAKRIKAIGL